MKQLNNPCSACVKTDNHCCRTDIPLSFADAILMMRWAKELKKNVVLGEHPEHEGSGTLVMIPNKPGIDINLEPCVFFDDNGQCEIYEDRPSICKCYGTEDMKCRYQNVGMWKKEDIANCSPEDIRKLDELALDKDFPILGKMVKFK